MDKSDIAKRMKDYEAVSASRLMKRCPVVCRIGGKAFHTLTRHFKRPFDEILITTMQETAKYLCEHLEGVVLSYQQSDEISLLFVDYKEINTVPYFDYNVQKLCSIIASMTTLAFNNIFADTVEAFYQNDYQKLGLNDMNNFSSEEEYDRVFDELEKEYEPYYNVMNMAMFDARVFNLPKDEVANYFYWRQYDASKNSIQMVGRAYSTHSELNKKSTNAIQDMLMIQKGINWNDFPTDQKRGSCVVREDYAIDKENGDVNYRTRWMIDTEIPIFRNEDRHYIEDRANIYFNA